MRSNEIDVSVVEETGTTGCRGRAADDTGGRLAVFGAAGAGTGGRGRGGAAGTALAARPTEAARPEPVDVGGYDGRTLLFIGIGVSVAGLLFGLVILNQLKNLPCTTRCARSRS